MPKMKVNARDPAKPKRALTAFMFFSKERRPKVLQDYPDIQFKDVGKKLGEQWKTMDPDEKVTYERLADEDKKRYAEAKKNYVPNPSYAKKSKRKDPNKPKRAMSAYLYFCKAHREAVKAEFPHKKMVEIQKVLGERWNQANDSDRAPYNKQAEADRERYDQEMMKLANKSSNAPPQEDEEDDEDEAGGEEEEDEDIGAGEGDGY